MAHLTITIDTAHPDIKAAAKATGLKGKALAERLLMAGARAEGRVPNPSPASQKVAAKPRRAKGAGSRLPEVLRESAADVRARRFQTYDNAADAKAHIRRVLGIKP